MLWRIWLSGLLRRRSGRLLMTSAGVAVAVALLTSVGAFLQSSQATMTSRTAADVAVDWQVEAQGSADASAVLATVRSQPGVITALPVEFGSTPGLSATSAGTTQATGTGVVLGLPAGYAGTFPAEIRLLVGSLRGPVLAQQTAANLRVHVGDSVTVQRAGLAPATITIAGVVDLPQADTLFQKVGAPTGSQPSAPPDNVVVMPAATWHSLFDAVAASRPDQVRHQMHVRLARDLPASPADAYQSVLASGHNLESRLAGGGLVGNNLAAALDAARKDAAYATVMFLFLGLPGVVLAGMLTAVVAGAGAARRQREQALLRARGASVPALLRLGLMEAAVIATVGALAGVGAALIIGAASFGSPAFGGGNLWLWALAAAAVGLLIALLVVAVPAWRDALRTTVAGARRSRRGGVPTWVLLLSAFLLLGAAAAIFAATSSQGYQLVLAPEGVPSITVDYAAFAGPACLWLGSAFLIWAAAETSLRRGGRLLRGTLRPAVGSLAGTISAFLSRQRALIVPAVALVGLTGAFAASTAIFNSTYSRQAEVDARLTNGADVTVTVPPGSMGSANLGGRLSSISGVQRVEPLLHRFAYVGADLQDLYAVQAQTIVAAGSLQDAYFQGGTAAQLMQRLAQQPDGILVSAETVKDFQLQPGDHLALRLQDQRTHALTRVSFRYVGIVKEFPTAPRDSFLLANAAYVGAATGDPAPSTYLIDTTGSAPEQVAAAVRSALGPGPSVTDITSTRHVVGSSLTAVDLNGLTRVELAFALVFTAGGTALLLALGLIERRRTFALAAALGAKPRQLAAFVWSEAAIVVAAGLLSAVALGWLLSQMLVAVLNGVFDPPPEALSVPWGYLGLVLGLSLLALGGVVLLASRRLGRSPASLIRQI